MPRALSLASNFFIAVVLSLSSLAWAQDAITVSLVPKVLRGTGYPALTVNAEQALDQVTLNLRRENDGKRIRLRSGPISAGRSHRFELKLKKGRAKFIGTLSVDVANGQSGEMPIEVEAEIIEPMTLNIDSADLDLKQRQLRLQADRGVAKIQITTMSDTGTPLGTIEHTYDGQAQPAGQKFSVKWKQSKGKLMRISITAWDSDGFYGAIELFPWKVDIPHEEVHFKSGSAAIDGQETSKLKNSLDEIQGAIRKYGALAKIRLFIAGHTDSVGDAASNRSLSKGRATSIGRWFRKHGIKIPILSAGLGEDQLLIQTPDNTAEAKNRRAEYVVAVEAPVLAGGAVWKKR